MGVGGEVLKLAGGERAKVESLDAGQVGAASVADEATGVQSPSSQAATCIPNFLQILVKPLKAVPILHSFRSQIESWLSSRSLLPPQFLRDFRNSAAPQNAWSSP